jgi:DNA-directed RNA polymerase specialized sigma24 family protein
MHNKSVFAVKPDAGLGTLVIVCSPLGTGDSPVISTAVAMLGDWPLEVLDDLTLARAAQSYLRRTMARLPVAPALERVWNWFYDQHWPVVEEEVRKSCPGCVSAADLDDHIQIVWLEILMTLPKRLHDPMRGDFSVWLRGLVREAVRRRLASTSSYAEDHPIALDVMEDLLVSSDLGPEDAYRLIEGLGELDAGLFRLRAENSPKSFEVFFRRFMKDQSAKEVGQAMGLKPQAVHACHSRLMQKFRAMLKGFLPPEWGSEGGLLPDFPPD